MNKYMELLLESDLFQINTLYSNTNIPRTIRFSAPIYDALMQAAAEENISFNLLVLQCCHYALSQKARSNGNNVADNIGFSAQKHPTGIFLCIFLFGNKKKKDVVYSTPFFDFSRN